MQLQKNQYHPLIWRGNSQRSPSCFGPALEHTSYFEYMVVCSQQLSILIEDLLNIFRYIYPHDTSSGQRNALCYGNESRSLLILACTEVEAQWLGILKANQATCLGKYWTTKDYVKLLPAMKLDEYSIRLAKFPSYPSIIPFDKWHTANSTSSLSWYDAYNQTKHDRSSKFEAAHLANVIAAIGACIVLHAAQFGPTNAGCYRDQFTVVAPEWPLADVYDLDNPNQYNPVNYQF